MRALTISLVLLTATALFAEDKEKDKAKEKTEWQKVSPKGSKIEIQFPGKPAAEENKDGSQFTLFAMKNTVAYALVTAPLPKKIDLKSKDDVKPILEGLRDGTIKALKGKQLSDKEIKLGKYPGRAVDVECDLGLYRLRVYVTETTLIQVFVWGPKEFSEGADVKKFVDSLKIGE